jgi:hypothetical protein
LTTNTVLLTGGRAPVCLELARAFAGAGWRVIVAESLPVHLCARSRAVAACHRVPEPNAEPAAFITALERIIDTEQIVLLLPTCEEIFWVARGLDRLQGRCRVLVEPLERLRQLHSKWAFIQLVASLGLPVPATTLLTERPSLAENHEGLVLKPVFSRFAAKVQLLQPGQRPGPFAPTAAQPWVAQQLLRGRHLSTWSVAHAGRLTAHADYAAEFRAGGGACISFRPAGIPAVEDWVSRFVGALGFTGQIAFDFIQTADGTLYPLECNPRATSGLHLLQPADLVRALTDPTAPVQRPVLTEVALRIPLLLFGPQGKWRRWLHLLRHAKDAIHRPGDPWPLVDQLRMLGPLYRRARRQGISLIEATTADLEWNGEA